MKWLHAAMIAATFGFAVPVLAQGFVGPGFNPGGPMIPANGNLHWSGDVDSIVTIYVHERHIKLIVNNGKGPRNVYTEIHGRISPATPFVKLIHWDGRGYVKLVAQPSPWNHFSAVVRVVDPQPGRGHYDIDLAW